jgi:hypothetical protein
VPVMIFINNIVAHIQVISNIAFAYSAGCG